MTNRAVETTDMQTYKTIVELLAEATMTDEATKKTILTYTAEFISKMEGKKITSRDREMFYAIFNAIAGGESK